MRLFAASVLAIASTSAAADPEVCPQLLADEPSHWPWDGEDLWPRCPVATPIASIGGRCTDGTRCMQPCESDVADDGGRYGPSKTSYTFRYDAAGRFLALMSKDASYLATECERDTAGHVTKCSVGNGREVYKYSYKAGRRDRVINEHLTQTYRYDPKGRLASETESGPYMRFTVTYSYNPDGTVAQHTVDDAKVKSVVKFEYEHGRLVALHSPHGETRYTYDDHARVVAEDFEDGNQTGHTKYTYDERSRLLETDTMKVSLEHEVIKYRYSCP